MDNNVQQLGYHEQLGDLKVGLDYDYENLTWICSVEIDHKGIDYTKGGEVTTIKKEHRGHGNTLLEAFIDLERDIKQFRNETFCF